MVLNIEDKAAIIGGNIDYNAGVTLLVNKPLGWTSFDVINKLRFALRKKTGIKKIKVGHAGTLDPLAEGLLIVCVGKHTKQIEKYQQLKKEYSGTIRLGAVTDTYDAEMEEKQHKDISHLEKEDIFQALPKFIGAIRQRPPVYSALKKGGTPLYKLARSGQEVEVPKREVHVYEFDILRIDWPELFFHVVCSKGTYIRSLANDLGQELGVGGYLSSLSRDAIGPYRKENAFDVEELASIIYVEENEE